MGANSACDNGGCVLLFAWYENFTSSCDTFTEVAQLKSGHRQDYKIKYIKLNLQGKVPE